MAELILLRHAKSQWNLENRFSGWVDNPLSADGISQMKGMAKKLRDKKIDVIYSSPLIRNQETISRLFVDLKGKYPIYFHLDAKLFTKRSNFISTNGSYVPVYLSQNLNEKYYGKLQGLNKSETIKKYGEEKVRLWRRSYKIAPPGGESLMTVCRRVIPFYKSNIQRDLKTGKNVLVVASHNSLRAIIKKIENLSGDEIANVEIPFGGIVVYEIGRDMKVSYKKELS